ncbi:MAG: LLM class F420-dependent oxidoreductase, partial [Actinomyces sp.]
HQSLDPFVALSFAAAVTERLRLLTYLSVAPYRNPCLLAKTAASVDALSGGRLVLGLGTGYLKGEFRALGVDVDERNLLFDEALDVLPRHWSGEPFDYDGTHFTCRGTIGLPRPVQDPIPIWIGGNAHRTLERVARRARGWMPLVGPAELFGTVRSPAVTGPDDLARRIGRLAELAGDRFGELDIVVPYTDPTLVDPTRDVERHRDRLGRLAELGATVVVVAPPPAAARDATATASFVESFAAVHL